MLQFNKIKYYLFWKILLKGKQCETVDACLFQPKLCKNGGTCQVTDNMMKCVCPPGYEPPYCEPAVVSFCTINVCSNGGTCIRVYDSTVAQHSMRCICPSGFSGVFCEMNSNSLKLASEVITAVLSDEIPSVCKNGAAARTSEFLKITRTPYSDNAYYLIQGIFWVWKFFMKEKKFISLIRRPHLVYKPRNLR